ncbi:MAG: hypothetical protein OXI97_05395 [Acidimicrobiaceae bacterium]|nr:hypothetical protein [Acidimicrobiaceae bacterium]
MRPGARTTTNVSITSPTESWWPLPSPPWSVVTGMVVRVMCRGAKPSIDTTTTGDR